MLSEKLSVKIHSDVVTGTVEDNLNAFHIQSPEDILRTKGTRDNKLYAVRGILAYNLGEGVMEMGGEYTHTRVLQSYDINDPKLDIENTNDKAVQNRSALFASYQTQWGKIGVSAGVRYENIVMDYYQNKIKNNEQSKKYNKLFPNILLSYSNNHIQTTVGYERKINYPHYDQLRSNIQYTSPFIYESGNPLLRPHIENSFFLICAWKELQAMAGYSFNKYAMHWMPSQFKDKAIILLRNENVKHSHNASFGLSYTPTIGIWRPQLEVGAMWQRIKVEDIDEKYNRPIFSGKWNNTFSLPKKWTLRVDASGRSNGHSGVPLIEPSWGIDLRMTKQFPEKGLSIRLSAFDIFKTNTLDWEMDYGKINMSHDKNLDSRSISLSATYRFNSTNSKYKGQQASDEINRL